MAVERELALSLYHESIEPYAYAEKDNLVVRLRVGSQLVTRVQVCHADKFLPAEIATTDAQWFASAGEHHALFQAVLRRASKRFKYYFSLVTRETRVVVYFSRAGLTIAEPSLDDAFEVPYLGERDSYQPPTWAAGTVYYQLFPERFARSRKRQLAIENGTIVHSHPLQEWDQTPAWNSFMGGDLDGIAEHLDHIEALGADVLYMTPVFTAPSNHKYDTVDYFQIDPDFGEPDALKHLTQLCHAIGMRVVIDAVFNHMGAQHPFFQSLLTDGEQSPYRNYIYAKSWPLSVQTRNYETFGYVAQMPKWRTATPAVEEYLCQIGEYWIREAAVDGWRLDVSDEVEHAFWRTFRSRIKQLQPSALIVGEIWQIATPWLRGEQFDSVMNYPFARAVLDWIAYRKTNANVFADRIDAVRAQYPETVLPFLWTLLDSHDTMRLLTVCKGDVQRVKLASFLQFTFIGSPMVYYGDEIGMRGGADPLCRGGMVWDPAKQNQSLFTHYKELGALRKQYPVLRTGRLREVWRTKRKQLYAFIRYEAPEADDFPGTSGELLLCAVNGGSQTLTITVTDPLLPVGTYVCVYGLLPERENSTSLTKAGHPKVGQSIYSGEDFALPPHSSVIWSFQGGGEVGQ